MSDGGVKFDSEQDRYKKGGKAWMPERERERERERDRERERERERERF